MITLLQHGGADLWKPLPEAQVLTVKHVAGPVKTATMLPVLLYHHALALGPALPQPEIMIKVMIRSPKLWYDLSQDRAMYIPAQHMTCLTFCMWSMCIDDAQAMWPGPNHIAQHIMCPIGRGTHHGSIVAVEGKEGLLSRGRKQCPTPAVRRDDWACQLAPTNCSAASSHLPGCV